MNGLKCLKNIIRPQQLMQIRSHTYYLSRRVVPVEILDENYDSTGKKNLIDLKAKQELWRSRDRRVPISWQTSIKYLDSEEYKKTYRGMKVWVPYRRNIKGWFENQPRFTRNRCIVDGFVVVGSPCPICRDKYLILHPKNTKLLEQFINPSSDDVYPIDKVMLCEYTYQDLVMAIELARDRGFMKFKVPFRQFDYDDFYSKDLLKELKMNDKLIEPDETVHKASQIINPTNQPYAKTKLPF